MPCAARGWPSAASATRPLRSATPAGKMPARRSLARCRPMAAVLSCRPTPPSRSSIDKSGQYWFELEDTDGVVGGQESRWEIHAVADAAAQRHHRAARRHRVGHSGGRRAAAGVAKDDLGVRRVTLHFQPAVGRATGPAAAGPAAEDRRGRNSACSSAAEARIGRQTAGSLAAGLPGDSRVVEYPWDLSKLDLAPGSQVTFAVSATDAAGQTGRSPDRRLIVITPEELADRLAQRQELILAELRRVLKVEREAEGQTARLAIQLREVGHLAKSDIDHARATELTPAAYCPHVDRSATTAFRRRSPTCWPIWRAIRSTVPRRSSRCRRFCRPSSAWSASISLRPSAD